VGRRFRLSRVNLDREWRDEDRICQIAAALGLHQQVLGVQISPDFTRFYRNLCQSHLRERFSD
jgi:hypothetical protein